MKRNDDRIWYDKGYSDGVRDTSRDSKVPKLVGAIILSALLVVDQYWILAFVIIYSAFELQEWHDIRKYHESDPPEQFE